MSGPIPTMPRLCRAPGITANAGVLLYEKTGRMVRLLGVIGDAKNQAVHMEFRP
jgi:hypothetical protein